MDLPENDQLDNHPITQVTILVPKHVSDRLPRYDSDPSTAFIYVPRSHGVAWRGIAPLLLEAPAKYTRKLLRILSQSVPDERESRNATNGPSVEKETSSASDQDQEEDDKRITAHSRRIEIQHFPFITVVLRPPEFSWQDSTFSSLVVSTELSLLRMQTLTAWWATLGGGYFFCKRLHVSLQLARQQGDLAQRIGNISMARQCRINEAYNLIYAGNFKAAKLVLSKLETSLVESGEKKSVTYRQSQAARLLAKRLKQVARKGLNGYRTEERGQKHAVDDFQRIRIVKS